MADRWRESGSEDWYTAPGFLAKCRELYHGREEPFAEHRVDVPFDSFKSSAGVWFYLHHDEARDFFKITLTDDVSVSIEMPRNQLRWMVGVCLDALKETP